jgi:hypothetical protein
MALTGQDASTYLLLVTISLAPKYMQVLFGDHSHYTETSLIFFRFNLFFDILKFF